jgi:hypothetical protein
MGSQRQTAVSVKRGNGGNVRVIGHAEPPKHALPKPSKNPRRRLTAKQQALIRALTKTKHLGKAAIEAGYSPKNATQSGAQALAAIQKTAPELLAKHGLDDDSLIEKHLIPLLQAQETKYFAYTRQGKRLLLERNVPAHSIRANALDMAFKIRGLYVREQENKGPEFSVVMIDRSYRPDWAAMRCAQGKIEVPGLPARVPKPLKQ